MNSLEKIRKGSFTIEAACVMSLVLLVLMGVLYLSFFVHNRAWLTVAACESALTGSMEGIRKDGQSQEAAAAERISITGPNQGRSLIANAPDCKHFRIPTNL